MASLEILTDGLINLRLPKYQGYTLTGSRAFSSFNSHLYTPAVYTAGLRVQNDRLLNPENILTVKLLNHDVRTLKAVRAKLFESTPFSP